MEPFTLSGTALAVTIGGLLALEWFTPLRREPGQVQYRWLTNFGLMLLGGIVIAALFPEDILDVASEIPDGWIMQWQLPLALEALLVFLLLDGWRYWEHRIFHEIPLFWRAHLVHHSDTSIDITTAQRHHPIEGLLAVCTSLLVLFALGFSAQSLAIYIAIATLSAFFTHANIRLPEGIDRTLRLLLVTPSVHAIHHSDSQPQTDSNYGTVLTVWDRLFGTYSDPATTRIPNFGLSYFNRPADTALTPVLLQPFQYRPGMVTKPREDAPRIKRPAITLSPAWRQALDQGLIGLLLALVPLWPTVSSLADIWSSSEPYQYAWLVLPMFIYVTGWFHRDRILAMTPRPDVLGLVVVLAAVTGWCLAYLVDIQLGQHLALVLVIQGIALATLGRSVYRQLFPIMAMLFMVIPCGDILQPLLRELTVKWIEWFTIVLELPHRVDGFMVYVGEHRYVVVDACSGLTFVTLAGFLGYSFGLLLFRSFAGVAALALTGAALGVLTNALRVWLIVGIDWLRGSQMDMAAHMDLQWLALLASLGLLFFLTARLAGAGSPVAGHSPELVVNWQYRRLVPILAGTIVAAVILPLQLRMTDDAGNPANKLQLLANAYPQSSWLEGERGENTALSIPYSDQIEVVLMQENGPGSKLNEALLRPHDQRIWRHTATTQNNDCSGSDCIQFIHKTWSRKGSDDSRHAFYIYYAGDTLTDSLLTYRVTSGWDRFTGSSTANGLIGFRVTGDISGQGKLTQAFNQIRSDLLSAGNSEDIRITDVAELAAAPRQR